MGDALKKVQPGQPLQIPAAAYMGNSVNHSASDYPSGFSLQAVRGNPVVQMQAEIGTDGSVYYSFSYENAEDGTCS